MPSAKNLFLVLFYSFYLLVSPTFAQSATDSATASAYPNLPLPTEGFKLTVSPPVLDLQTQAGQPVTAEIKVKSFSQEPEDIRVSLMKFVASDTGDKPKLLELEPTDLFPQWVSFSEDRFILQPETWKSINLTYNPPVTAPPGQYFTIVFNREREVEMPGGAVAKGAAAILVLSQVNSSRVHRQLDLALLDGNRLGFKTARQIYEFLPVEFQTTLTNAGNVHELIKGNIFVHWNTGRRRDIDILEVNPEKSFTLPQTTRTFISTWTNGFPIWETQFDDAGNPVLDKHGRPTKKLKWDLSKLTSFRIGKYSATLILIYNDGTKDIPIEAETSFWVIPWRILLVLLIVCILLFFGLKSLFQSTRRRLRRLRQHLD
jgi:hypothetical protein